MRFCHFRWLLAASLILRAASPAAAQIIPGWDSKQFSFERIDAERIRLMREVEVNGTGANQGQQIFADELEWNTVTGEFTAIGNVLLSSPTARMAADRVVFNTRTGLGTFYSASGLASLGDRGLQDKSMFGTLEPDIYFYGEVIEKIGSDKYRITRGSFTTCVQPTPRWDIVTGKAVIDLEDYAVLRNAVVRVKDVPVFYLPLLYYPIQSDDRATGFLLPTYGTSTYRGQSLSNAFFWAINRSQDLTLMHDWFTKTGQGAGAEYRYVIAPGSEGGLRAYRLAQKEAVFEQAGGGSNTTPAVTSFNLNGAVAQELPFRLRARARVEYFSSLTTQQLYNQNIYDTSQRQRTFGGSVTGAWGLLNLTGNFQRSEIFTTATNSIVNGFAPSLTTTISSKRLGRLPLYVSVNSDAGKIIYKNRNEGAVEQDFGLAKFDATPTLRAALSNWPFLNVNASTAYRYTYFSESLDATGAQVPIALTRRYFDLRADIVGPVFSRVYTPNNALADRLKHVIEPTLSLQRITDFPNLSRVVTATSSYDFVIGGVTRLNYGLTNRLLVRKAPAVPNPSSLASAPRELVSVNLSQSYYTDARASAVDPTYQSSFQGNTPSNFSPIALTVRAAPTALSTATVRMEYDTQKGELRSFSATANSNYRAAQVTGGWSTRSYSQSVRENALNAAATLNFFKGQTGGTYILNWDIERRYIIQQRWVGFYNAQCCGLGIEYQEYNFPFADPRFPIAKDRRFNLSFTLAGIGTFSNFFGAFGGPR